MKNTTQHLIAVILLVVMAVILGAIFTPFSAAVGAYFGMATYGYLTARELDRVKAS